MRLTIAAAFALAGCSQAPTPAANAVDPTETPTVAEQSGLAAADRGLTGQVSSLSADSSGLNVRTSDTKTIIELPADTLFAFDKADLTPEAATNLTKVADLIRQAPAGAIDVVGYTDAEGDDAYNLGLSEQRAQSVVNWMREQVGVRQRAFEVIGKGEAGPVAPNAKPDGSDDPEGRAQNRRVVVSIPR